MQFDFGLEAETLGALVAEGTADQPIRFTSAQRFANPLPGDWQGLTFAPDSYGSLQHANIEFAVNGLTLNGGEVSVMSSTIAGSEYDGILVPTGTLSLTLSLANNSLAGNGRMAITLARGALFEGGQYEILTDFDPVVTRLITESTDHREEELPYFVEAWRPAESSLINTVRTGDSITQRFCRQKS